MKQLSMILGLCLLFAFGLTTEIQANNSVETAITIAKEKTITLRFMVTAVCANARLKVH